MAKLYNLAAMTVSSIGTGTITLGSAATILGVLYLSFTAAGASNGETVAYSITDVAGSEIGTGVIGGGGTTLTRIPAASTNANAAINMTAAAIVRISPAKEDLANLRENNLFTGTQTINPTAATAATVNKGFAVTHALPSSGTATGPLLLNSITATNPGTMGTTGAGGWDSYGQIQNQTNALRVNYASSGASTTNNGAFSVANFVTAATESYGGALGTTINADATGHQTWGVIGYVTVWASGKIHTAVGVEAEVGISTGGTADYRIGVGANSQGPVQGSTLDAAFNASTITNQVPGAGTTTGWQHLMALSTPIYGGSLAPITTTGDFFFSDTAMTVAHFANLSNVTVTGNILSFPNVTLTGAGLLTTPIHAGGSGAASTLTLESTTGTGTTDAIIGKTGSQVERFRVTTGGLFNIGPAIAPDTLLTVNGNTAAAVALGFGVPQMHLIAPDGQIGGAFADVYGAQGLYLNRHASGTQGAKTASVGGAVTLSVSAQHWDGSAYSTSAAIDMGTINLQSSTDHSGFWRVRTISTVASDALTERIRVQKGLIIGNTTNDGGIGTVLLNPQAFGSLAAAAAGLKGAMAVVNDSNTAVIGATIAAGGANLVLAFCNGTNWIVK